MSDRLEQISYGCGTQTYDDGSPQLAVSCTDERKYDVNPGNPGCFTQAQFLKTYGQEGPTKWAKAVTNNMCPYPATGSDGRRLTYTCYKPEGRNIGTCKNVLPSGAAGFSDFEPGPAFGSGFNNPRTGGTFNPDSLNRSPCGGVDGLCGFLGNSYDISGFDLSHSPPPSTTAKILNSTFLADNISQVQKFYRAENTQTNELTITTGNEEYIMSLKGKLDGSASGKASGYFLQGSLNAEGGLSKQHDETHNSLRLEIGKSGFDVILSLDNLVSDPTISPTQILNSDFILDYFDCGLSPTFCSNLANPPSSNTNCILGFLDYSKFSCDEDGVCDNYPRRKTFITGVISNNVRSFLRKYGTHILTGMTYAGGITAIETKNNSHDLNTNQLAAELCASIASESDGLTQCSAENHCPRADQYCDVPSDSNSKDIKAVCKRRNTCSGLRNQAPLPKGDWETNDGPCTQIPGTTCDSDNRCSDPDFYCPAVESGDRVCVRRCDGNKKIIKRGSSWNTKEGTECGDEQLLASSEQVYFTRNHVINDNSVDNSVDSLSNWARDCLRTLISTRNPSLSNLSSSDRERLDTLMAIFHLSKTYNGLKLILNNNERVAKTIMNILKAVATVSLYGDGYLGLSQSSSNTNIDNYLLQEPTSVDYQNINSYVSSQMDDHHTFLQSHFVGDSDGGGNSGNACASVDYASTDSKKMSANYMKITIRGGTQDAQHNFNEPGADTTSEEGATSLTKPIFYLFSQNARRNIATLMDSIHLDPDDRDNFNPSTGTPVYWSYTSIFSFVDSTMMKFINDQFDSGSTNMKEDSILISHNEKYRTMTKTQLLRVYQQAKNNIFGILVDRTSDCGGGKSENLGNLNLPKYFMAGSDNTDGTGLRNYACWTPDINDFKNKYTSFYGPSIECTFCNRHSTSDDGDDWDWPWAECSDGSPTDSSQCKPRWNNADGVPLEGLPDNPSVLQGKKDLYWVKGDGSGTPYSGGSPYGGPVGSDYKPRMMKYTIDKWDSDVLKGGRDFCKYDTTVFINECDRNYDHWGNKVYYIPDDNKDLSYSQYLTSSDMYGV